MVTIDLTNFDPSSFTYSPADAISMEWNGEDTQYYVRLGTFLQYMQNGIMPKIYDNNGKYIPSLFFNTDTETNLMYVDPLQVSVDPMVCVVKRTLAFTSGEKIKFTSPADDFISSDLKTIFKDVDYGKIMNIYLNFTFILSKLEGQETVVLIDFLKDLMSGINEALGGINDFDVFIDETTNTVKIIDKNPLPHKDEILNFFDVSSNVDEPISTELVEFDLFGYNTKNTTAGFIKAFDFKTELTPQFSTMITVGAAAQGSVVGEDSTALSKINIGLEDRYKTKMVNGNFKQPNAKDIVVKIAADKTAFQNLQEKYKVMYAEYTNFLKTLSIEGEQTYNEDDVNTYKTTLPNLNQVNTEFLKAREKQLNPKGYQNNIALGTGFIPFNLSLTMDGLSGMKINQKFTVNTSFLPSNYPNNVEFLIKNMAHEISNNKWFTKIESYCISKGNYTGTTGEAIRPDGNNTQESTPWIDPSVSTKGVWADKLREVITQLGYIEKGKEIDSGGDITESIYNASSEVLKNIKTELPALKIRVSSGNDFYHKGVKYNSKHKIGDAIDFTITPQSSSDLAKVTNILQVYKIKNPAFKFINEYTNPSSAATAGHFHLQVQS